ncbi:lysM and putative peptidoglycan-binding domain-containing protein 4 [Thalassophryne amazonica]|uniref:lysM and putative peptidoglycan-binding domain-containing protein 4 n=1 Tax=Thalassophryne amazonica TaxID=390379 RepID=UPI0014708FE9|nr:lysM and putative peptidoglycan-binding domain-containing protein 4 [Thalassophryne amazonica]XP_034032440.1 lysM and putative peptidoglycan-binding domain-containing protein 4 [Thalassophryne amazonica]
MWRGEGTPRAFQAPVDVHASADGQVYMFKRRPNESAISSEDEELRVLEMRPQVFQDEQQDRLQNVELLEREVLDGDSLNKLALQYGCKVADIKRANNLMQEQDLFALKSIKIPVQKHSFLTESFTDLSGHQQQTVLSSVRQSEPQDGGGAQPNVQEVTDFLMEVDHDIEKLIHTMNDGDDVLNNSKKPERIGFRGRRLTSHGADWGIHWWNAVIAMFMIGIVLPLFYVIYFKTRDSATVSPAGGGSSLLSSIVSSNSSNSGLSTTGPDRYQEPG